MSRYFATASFALRQFYYLQILDSATVYLEAYQSLHQVETVAARRPGVDVQQAERAVVFHLQDVRVAADEQPGRLLEDVGHHRAVVPARVAADVRHPHVHLFAAEAVVAGEKLADVLPVDVAPHAAHGLERLQTVHHVHRPPIARVPHLIACGKMPEYPFVEQTVRVRKQSYAFHGRCIMLAKLLKIWRKPLEDGGFKRQ